MSRRDKGLSRRTADGNVEEMNPQARSTTSYWWALGIVGTFALTLVILLLAGVLGSTAWWTAVAMILLAISQVVSILSIRRNNRRIAARSASLPPANL
mgnify:CR=1 FL=1